MKDKYGLFPPLNVIFRGIPQTQVIVYIFILILLAENRKKTIKETVLLTLHFKIYFPYIKMGLYTAKVVIQNDWL